MDKFKQKFDDALARHKVALAEIMDKYKDINEESIFDKDHFEIAHMIHEQTDQVNYCNVVIDLYERNIEYLYEIYTLKEYRNKHINIVLYSLIISGAIAFFGGLPFALIAGGISYAFLSKRELHKYIDDIKHHKWQLDSIVDLKHEIKKLEELKT